MFLNLTANFASKRASSCFNSFPDNPVDFAMFEKSNDES